VPTLLIHGKHDQIAGYWESVAYAKQHPNTKLVTLDAGLFAMLVRSETANAELRTFVASVTGTQSALLRGEAASPPVTARRSP